MTLQRITTYLGIGVLLAMLLSILAIAVSEVHSFDVFWQLQSGKYMAETRSFIRQDTFSLMKDVSRAEHTWLHSLILYASYLLGGYGAISVLKGTVVALTLLVLMLTARIRMSSIAAIALLVPIFIMTSGGWLERPQIWTFLCFSIFVLVMELFVEKKNWVLLWLIPLFLFWSNAHAGAALALAVLSAYFVGENIRAIWKKTFRKADLIKWVTLLGGLFVAGLLNPNPSVFRHALNEALNLIIPAASAAPEAAQKSSRAITHVFNMDWTPTTFQQEPLFFYAMGVVALVFVLGWRRIRLSDLCLMAGLAFMGLKLVRHIPFFYMGAIAICPIYLDAAVKPITNRLPDKIKQGAVIVVLLIAVGIFWWLYRPVYNVYGTFTTGLREWHYPIQATEFVKEHQLPKNIYNTYDWGGYMAWQLYPDYLVFWDGRQTSTDMFSLGWQVMAGHPGWEDILKRFDVKTIVSRASTIDTGQKYPLLDRLRNSSDWSLVFNTESSMVFVRKDSVSANWLQRYARPKERMDDTILSESHLMVKYNPNRYMAWWEMAQIYAKRKQYSHALFAVRQHLARSPKPNPAALQLQKQLSLAVKGKK